MRPALNVDTRARPREGAPRVRHLEERRTCPACRGTTLSTLLSRGYGEPALRRALEGFYGEALQRDYDLLLGASFTLLECRDCGTIFQRDVPDAFLLAKLYEEWIDPAMARRNFESDTRPDHRLDLARDVFLAVTLASARQQRGLWHSLDYGCGWGDWASMSRAFGAEAWGTELSAVRSAFSRDRGIHLESERGLPPSRFLVINANQVLEHVPDPRETLQRLSTALHPDGVMRVAVPNGRNIRRHLRQFDRELARPRGGALYAVAPLQHLCCFDSASLARLGAACGLRRVLPSWSSLLKSVRWHGAGRATLRALLRPFYLRSRYATDVYFQKAGARP